MNNIVTVRKAGAISGIVSVEGAKNAVLPILPATLLVKGISTIYNVPPSQDVYIMIQLLESYGADVSFNEKKRTVTVDASNLENAQSSIALFQSIRASTLFAGALLGRFGEAWIGSPGGDNIGKRPIDMHLDAFEQMGASYFYKNNYVAITSKKLSGAEIFLLYPSVGATQNILLAASAIDEKTVIYNAAQEPEVLDLISALSAMGAKIECSFGNTITIFGTLNPKPFEHHVMPDRLEAGTIAMAAAITHGAVTIINAPCYGMHYPLKILEKMGHKVDVGPMGHGLTLIAADKPKPIKVKTMPYPGFPTDLQSPIMALLSITQGVSSIHETVFESRMKHGYELNKMGANISIEYDCAHIHGVENLYGTHVEADNIRSCSALLLAGLVAEGETIIKGAYHLLRGHAGLDEKLRLLGGDVKISYSPVQSLNKESLQYKSCNLGFNQY